MVNQQADGPRDRAKALLNMVLRQAAELDNFLSGVQEMTSPDEFNQLRTIVANIMGSVLLDAINPIVAKYPDLKPRELG